MSVLPTSEGPCNPSVGYVFFALVSLSRLKKQKVMVGCHECATRRYFLVAYYCYVW